MADSSAKKRKRASNAAETSNKKTTSQLAASGNISVSHVNLKGLHPVFATSTGVSAPSISFQAFAKENASETTDAIADPKSHSILLHSSKHPRLDYTAAASADGLAHYVAIYDPRSSSMKIVPAHHARLHAVLRSEAPAAGTSRKTNLEQRNDLGQEFGTKKAKKLIASRTVNAITNVGAKAEEAQNAILDDVGKRIGKAKSEREQLVQSLSAKPMPMPNLDATAIEDVYPLDSMISTSEFNRINVDDWTEQQKDKVKGVDCYHRFPANRINNAIKDNKKFKALRYVALLLQFHSALLPPRKGVHKVPPKDKLHAALRDYNTDLISSVRQKFSRNGDEVGKFELDKLCTYICALSLYIDGYSTDISDLRLDLRLEQLALSKYYQELGCKLRALTEAEKESRKVPKALASTIRIAKLPAPPIEFPKVRMGRRK